MHMRICLLCIALWTPRVLSVPPVVTNLPNSVNIIETSVFVTPLLTVSATDPESEPITFTMTGSPGSPPFFVDPGGVVAYDGTGLDFETTPVYTLDISVHAGADTVGPLTLTVSVLDFNEIPYWAFSTPLAPNPPRFSTVDENLPNGADVYTPNAIDPEGLPMTFGVEFIRPFLPAGQVPAIFAFNTATGQLTAVNPPGVDFEAYNPGLFPNFICYISANDGVKTTYFNYDMLLLLSINNINEAPTITLTPAATSVIETQTATIDICTASATDPDASPSFTYSIVTTPLGAPFSINPTSGVISVDVNPGFDFAAQPSYSIDVTVSDGLLPSVATLVVSIINVNGNPSLTNVPAPLSLPENTGVSVVYTAAATDPDTDPITFSMTTVPVASPFSINTLSGAISLTSATLDFETLTTYTLTVTASDGSLSDVQDLTVNVQDINEAPSISNLPNTVSVPENAPGSSSLFQTTSSDPDGDALTYAITAPPAAFTCNAGTGEIRLALSPGFDFETTPIFTLDVTAADAGFTATSTLTVSITDANEAPTLGGLPASVNVAEDTVIQTTLATATCSDPDASDTCTYSITTVPVVGIFSISLLGVVTLDAPPNLDFETVNQYTITVRVTDAGALFAQSSFTVDVTDVNEAPSITNAPGTTSLPENQVASSSLYQAITTDPEGDAIVYSMTTAPAAGPFDISLTGEVTVQITPALDFETTPQYLLNIVASDGPLFVMATLTVDITDINEPPMITGLPATLSFSEYYLGIIASVTVTDPEGGVGLTTSVATVPPTPPNLPFTLSPGGLLIVNDPPGLDFEIQPTYTITITATDGGGLIAVAVTVLTLIDESEPPIITNLPTNIALREDSTAGSVVFTVAAVDPDADLIIFVMVSSPSDGKFLINGLSGAVSYIANPGFDFETTSQYQLTVAVNDGILTGIPKILTVDITDVNEKPVITSSSLPVSVPEDVTSAAVIYNTVATDPEGDTLAYQMSVSPPSGVGKFSIDSVGGGLSITSSPGFDFETVTQFVITLTVTDGALVSDPIALNIDVTNANERPTFAVTTLSATFSESEVVGYVIPVTLIATDPDVGDTLTYTVVGSLYSSYITLDTTSGVVVKLANAIDYENPTDPKIFSVDIRVRDTGTLQDISQLTITVTDENDNTPTFSQNEFNLTLQDSLLVGTNVVLVPATDLDSSGPITYTLIGVEGNMYFQINPVGLVTVKVPVNLQNNDVITFTVTAADGGVPEQTATTTVNVHITDVNNNRPVFDQGFYNFQIRDDADIGQAVGTIHATDMDTVNVTVLTYLLVVSTDTFTLDGSSGVISTKVQPISESKYTLYAAAKDNGIPTDTSENVVIRVDVFSCAETMVDVEISQPATFFDQTTVAQLEQELSNQFSPAQVRVSEVKDAAEIGKSVVSLYFITDNSTFSLANINSPKTFKTADELLTLLTIDSAGTPASSLTGASLTSFPVTKVVCTCCTTDILNWFISTPEGIATLAILCLLALALLVGTCIGLGFAIRYCFKKSDGKGITPVNNRLITKPKPFTVKPTPLTARMNPPTTRPVAKSEGLYDFRYKDNSKADNTSRVSPQPREKGSRTGTPPNKVSPSPKSDIWYEVPPSNGSAQLGSPQPSFSRTSSALSDDLFSLTVSTPRVTPLPTTDIPSISNYEEPMVTGRTDNYYRSARVSVNEPLPNGLNY